MNDIVKLAAVSVAATLCAVVVRKQAPELALVLAVAAASVLLLSCMDTVEALLELVGELGETAGLSEEIVKPVIKTAGIAVVTRITADICRDAQQSGLACALETAGTFLAIFAATPLLTAVLNLILELL